MSIDTRLTDLLVRWEELREQGHSPTPEELCRDCPELLDPLRAQLRRLGQLDALLETTPPHPAGPAPAPHDGSCGPYRPLRLIGVGGAGEVYLADDSELNRQVALKRMQAHLAADQDLRRRFLLEAEVTGRLEHPGVVPVYGMGLDAAGKPYYAMRFIRGESLQEAVARFHQADAPGRDPSERSLALRGLLARFVALCNAVAYAHSRGIVHRDLKPANVMLGPFGETLVVDWGLARPVARAEADRPQGEETIDPSPGSKPSETRGVVGTPAYMSPEQAGGRQALVGPGSDVYGLGATLYAILTGQAPFEKGRLDEVLERVRRGEFPPPRRRKPEAPPALEAVCLKAMALRREGRYASAAELARDVEAWLADEPVSARKEPVSERARRWVKNHRAAVLATLAAGLIALLALAALALLQRAANRTERGLREEAEQAFLREKRGLEVAQDTNSTLLQLAEELRPAPGMQGRALDRVLSAASRRYDELRRAAGDRAEVREGKARVLTALSETRVQLGDTTAALAFAREAEKLYRGLVQDRPEEPRLRGGLATALERVGAVLPLQGRYRESLAAHREALGLRAGLARESPGESRWQLDLAKSHHWVGNLLNGEGDAINAEREYRRAFDLRRRVVEREPHNQDARARLAISHWVLGDAVWYHWERRDALRHYEKAVALLDGLLRDDPNHDEWQRIRTGAALSLSESLMEFRREKEAQVLIEGCVGTARVFSGLDPTHAEWQRVAYRARHTAARLLPGRSQDERLLAYAQMCRENLPVTAARARLDPANVEWQINWASARMNLASNLLQLSQLKIDPEANVREAAKLLDEAAADVIPLARRHPDRQWARANLRTVLRLRAQAQRMLGNPDPTGQAPWPQVESERDYYERRRREEPENLSWIWHLSTLYREAITSSTDLALAVDYARRAIALAEELRRREPEEVRWLEMLQWAHDQAAVVYNSVSLYVAADRHPTDAAAAMKAQRQSRASADKQASLRIAFKLREKIAYLKDDSPDALQELANAYRKRAEAARASRDLEGARGAYGQFLATMEHLHRKFPDEARRDPLQPEVDVARQAPPRLRQSLLTNGRGLIAGFDGYQWADPRPSTANELIHRIIELVQALDVGKPSEAEEARWALRRGLLALDELQAAGELAAPLARLVPFFERRLASLLPAPKEITAGSGEQRAWQRMSYEALARLLAARPRELAQALAADARTAAGQPWSATIFRRHALLGLLSKPELLTPLLKAARGLAADDGDPLGPAGRAFFAELALCAGEREHAQALDGKTATAGLDTALAGPLARKLDAASRSLAQAGKAGDAEAVRRIAARIAPPRKNPPARPPK